nr:MAG TPA: helix-turn-helix protein [Caudoviricetes sp.]
MWDTGKSKPYWVFHKKLAKLYGVTVEELMKEE